MKIRLVDDAENGEWLSYDGIRSTDKLKQFLLTDQDIQAFFRRLFSVGGEIDKFPDHPDGKSCFFQALDQAEIGKILIGELPRAGGRPGNERQQPFLVIIAERRRRDAEDLRHFTDAVCHDVLLFLT